MAGVGLEAASVLHTKRECLLSHFREVQVCPYSEGCFLANTPLCREGESVIPPTLPQTNGTDWQLRPATQEAVGVCCDAEVGLFGEGERLPQGEAE